MGVSMLTWIFGGATLVSLLIQILGAFSEYKEVRNSISFVIFGIFLGTIIGAISPSSFVLSLNITWFHLLLIALGVIVVGCVCISEMRENKPNDGFTGLAIFSASLFFLVLVFGSMTNLESPSEKPEEQFSIEELVAIKDFNLERQNYEKAISRLKQIRAKIPVRDPRHDIIDDEIKKIQNEQLK